MKALRKATRSRAASDSTQQRAVYGLMMVIAALVMDSMQHFFGI